MSVKGVDITKSDYKGFDYKKNYNKFISKLNEIEKNVYNGDTLNKKELLNMIFTILANDKSAYDIISNITKWSKWDFALKSFTNKEADSAIAHISKVLDNVDEVINNRHYKKRSASYYSGMNGAKEIGDIFSLLYNSHNLSKDYFHEKVKDFLNENTYKNRS